MTAAMAGAATTTNPAFVTAYSDDTGTSFVEGSSDGALSGSSQVTLVAAPAASTRRLIKTIYIANTDTVANTISNLIRGTAGTAVTAHSNGSTVYNMSSNNLFGKQYQNYTVEDTTVANGVATVFNAPSITLSTSTTTWVLTNTYALGNIVKNSGNFYRAKQAVPANTPIANTQYWQPLSTAVEVYVGGQRISSDLYTITAESPVQVTFDTAPAAGSNVTVLVRRGTWVDY